MQNEKDILRWLGAIGEIPRERCLVNREEKKSQIKMIPPEWWITSISTRFAELGRRVYLAKTNYGWDIEAVEYYYEDLIPFGVFILGHGDTPHEAWMDAAENNVNGGEI